MATPLPIAARQIAFDPSPDRLIASRSGKQLTVLSGPNNSGKSYLSKALCSHLGKTSHFFGCNRFFHVREMPTAAISTTDFENRHANFAKRFSEPFAQNDEPNDLPLDSIIRSLNNERRNQAFAMFGQIMGRPVSLKHIVPDNVMTPYYIDVGGEPLPYSSTGTRLLLTLLTTLYDQRIEYLFLDEPELGLAPKVQTAVANFLTNKAKREKELPHLKALFITTHSHLFLDRTDLSNNFIAVRDGDRLTIRQMTSVSEFHELQFAMLGNDLESLFMPSLIVVVEGKSDHAFLTRLFAMRFPSTKITVVIGESDGGVQTRIQTIKEAIGDLPRSPYHNRVIAVLDSKNSVKQSGLLRQGVHQDNIKIWSKNGIEHFYPSEAMKDIFCCDDDTLKASDVDRDPIEINGIRKSKAELGTQIAARLASDTVHHLEVQGLLTRIEALLG
jgi:predicted ATPase